MIVSTSFSLTKKSYRKENGDKIIIPLQQYIGDVSRMVKPDYSLVDVDGYLDAERKNVSNQNLEPKARTASIISSYGCSTLFH